MCFARLGKFRLGFATVSSVLFSFVLFVLFCFCLVGSHCFLSHFVTVCLAARATGVLWIR